MRLSRKHVAENTEQPLRRRERGIMFKDELVRAILEGRKFQTRRLVKPQPSNPEMRGPISPIWGYGVPLPHVDKQRRFGIHAAFDVGGKRKDRWLPCPYGAPGDTLWVRECWQQTVNAKGYPCTMYRADGAGFHILAEYGGEGDPCGLGKPTAPLMSSGPWRPSLLMPRWASRITLPLASVRVERLQDITEEDAQAEGVESAFGRTFWRDYLGKAEDVAEWFISPRDSFFSLWKLINGLDSYWANPWVWVLTWSKAEVR